MQRRRCIGAHSHVTHALKCVASSSRTGHSVGQRRGDARAGRGGAEGAGAEGDVVCRDMMVGLARVMVRYALLQVDQPRQGRSLTCV